MNRNLNIFLWIVFFSLMAPSGMALASWNAVPGDSTYGMKLAMEKVLLLAISPSSQLQSTTNFKLTERRMGEVTKVLSGVHAKESLDNLTMQIEATRKSLSGITDEQAKKEAIAKYIETLHQVTTQLEEQKVNRAISYLPPQQKTTTSYKIVNPRQTTTTPTTAQTQTARPVVNNVTNNYYYQNPPATGGNTNTRPTTTQPITTQPTATQQPAIPTANPTNSPVTPTAQPPEEEIIQPDVVENINDTQEEIDQVIEELEQEAQNIPNTTSVESQPQESEPPQQQERPQQENNGGNNGQGQGNGNGNSQQNENNGQGQANGNSETNGGE